MENIKEELEKTIKPLTDKIKEQDAQIKEMEGKLSKDITRKLVNDPKVSIVSTPEESLTKDKFGGFKSKSHFLVDTIKAGHGEVTETMQRWNAACKTSGYMEESDASQGGYTVPPPELLQGILEKSLEASIIKPRARIQPISANAIELVADVDADHSTNYFGGITIQRPGEGGTKTATNPVYAKIGLKLHKVTGLVHVTDELLEDSQIALEADITRKFGEAIAFVQDDDFINGTGVNQPLGIFNSANPALVSVTKETNQGAATIVYENIVNMWARLWPRGQANAVWLANIETFPQIATMGLSVGVGGVPVWMPAGGASGAAYSTLFGRPLIFTEKMQALGTAGDIGLVDLSQYVVGQKGDGNPILATSIHFKFDVDMTSFRFVLRYDGQPTWTAKLTPKRGSGTLSPFVILAVRS